MHNALPHFLCLHLAFQIPRVNILQVIRGIDPRERLAFRLHLSYSVLEGFALGVLALNEFVFVKSLHGTPLQLSFLFQFSMIVFLFLVFLNEFIRRTRNRKRLLRHTALITRLPLLLLGFFPLSHAQILDQGWWHAAFLGIFLVYYLGSPVIYPSINLLLKQNYRLENFGKLYSYATSLNKVVMMVTTFIYGLLLDANHYAFVYVFPLIGLISVLSGFVLSAIPYVPEEDTVKRKGIQDAVRTSIVNMVDVLRSNQPYRHFEIGFMLYGFAFMSTVTVIVLFFYEGLNLSYSSVAFYRNAYNVGAILLLPMAGRLIGHLGPRRFAMIAFGSIAGYLLSLVLTQRFPLGFNVAGIEIYWGLLLYIAFHSVFASSMPLLWNIGSAYFSSPAKAGLYQEIHLSLTGFRAVFSPLIGVLLYEAFGFTATFLTGTAVLILAMGFLYWSYTRSKLPIDDQAN